MNINDLIDNFAVHLKQYGLDGDPDQTELYKWEIISKYHDKLDPDSSDFIKTISEINFRNLWYYGTQRNAVKHFAGYEPDAYRFLHKNLYDESKPLQERVTAFTEGCKKLWDSKIKQYFPTQNTSAQCDECLISCFLTAKYPEKYTFYKSEVYENLCELFGVKPKDAGEKLVHFYKLMDEKVIPLVQSNTEICELVDEKISQHNYISSLPLTAQTVIWNAIQQGFFHKKKLWLFYPGDDKQIFDDMVKDNYISVYQWGEIGSLESIKYKKDIEEALKEKVDEYKTKKPSYSTQMLYDMKRNMKIGDYVVCRNKDFSQIVAYGEITGGYFFNPDHPVNKHCVEVQWNDGQWDITQLLKDSKDPKSTVPRLQNVSKKDWGQKIMNILEGTDSTKTKATPTPNNSIQMEELELLKLKKQIILQGAPGTGKTYKTASIAVGMCNPSFTDFSDHQKVMEEYEKLQNEGRIAFCTFHQSMDYEDFIEGLKPEVKGSAVEYNVESGIFKTICEKAKKSNEPYVLIIDEINRGNISKIFGELITLLEADKRSNGTHPISLKLPYSKEDFSVPSNLYIIGTMNTTDRSTGTIDYAVRRRFAFVTLEAKEDVIKDWCNAEKVPANVKDAALELFDQISKFIAEHKAADFELEDLKVGHCYFMAKDMNALRLKMRYEVVPLLKEYIKDGILRSLPEDEKYFESWKKAEYYKPTTTVVITE